MKPAKPSDAKPTRDQKDAKPQPVPEVGGAKGPDPTRYGDWQHKGRVSDF